MVTQTQTPPTSGLRRFRHADVLSLLMPGGHSLTVDARTDLATQRHTITDRRAILADPKTEPAETAS